MVKNRSYKQKKAKHTHKKRDITKEDAVKKEEGIWRQNGKYKYGE
jgi:hypothetical protein